MAAVAVSRSSRRLERASAKAMTASVLEEEDAEVHHVIGVELVVAGGVKEGMAEAREAG